MYCNKKSLPPAHSWNEEGREFAITTQRRMVFGIMDIEGERRAAELRCSGRAGGATV